MNIGSIYTAFQRLETQQIHYKTFSLISVISSTFGNFDQ